MIKKIVIMLFIGAVIWVVVSLGLHFFSRESPPAELPETQWVVLTASRVYYSDKVLQADNTTFILEGYWEYISGEWRFNEGNLELNERFGNVRVMQR